MATTLNFTSAPFTRVTQFTSADTTTTKDILSATASVDRRIYGITVYTDETVARDLFLYISDGTTTWRLTTINLPINSGNTNAIVPVDVFASTQTTPFIKNRDASGAPYLHLPKTWSLRASYGASMSATRVGNIVIVGEIY